MSELSYFVAFGAGLLSFFSPCILPLMPAYLANLAGSTVLDTSTKINYRPVLFHSLSFVIGFSLIFVALGISAGLLGGTLILPQNFLSKIAGGVIVAFGLFLIASFRIPWLNYEKRLRPIFGNKPGYTRSFLLGAFFALGWTPCVGPILGSILTLALSSQTAGYGGSLLVFYSLGLGIPFILLGLTLSTIMPLWKSLNRYSGAISLTSGFLLVILGVLIFTGNLTWLIQFSSFWKN